MYNPFRQIYIYIYVYILYNRNIGDSVYGSDVSKKGLYVLGQHIEWDLDFTGGGDGSGGCILFIIYIGFWFFPFCE